MDILDSKSDIGGPLYKRMVHNVTNCKNDPNSPHPTLPSVTQGLGARKKGIQIVSKPVDLFSRMQ